MAPDRDPITRVNAALLQEQQRIGLGRWHDAGWLSEDDLLIATANGLFRHNLTLQTTALLLHRHVRRLAIARGQDRAAALVEAPREILLLSAREGRTLKRVKPHGGNIVNALAFSPDGAWLASGGTDRMLRVRRSEDGQEVLALAHPGGATSADGNPDRIVFAPDGAHIVSHDNAGVIYVWSQDGRALARWQAGRWIDALCFVNADCIAACVHTAGATATAPDRILVIWNLRGKQLHELALRAGDLPIEPQFALAIARDQPTLISGGRDQCVRIWDMRTWCGCGQIAREQLLPPEHAADSAERATIRHLEYSPEGRQLLVATAPAPAPADTASNAEITTLQVWTIDGMTRRQCLTDFHGAVHGAVWCGDARIALATDRGARLHDIALGKSRGLTSAPASAVACSQDGHTLGVGGRAPQATALLIDLERDERGPELQCHKSETVALSFSPDDAFVAVAAQDVRIYKRGRKSAARRVEHPQVKSIAHSHDGRWLATAGWDGAIRIWDTAEAGRPREIYGDSQGRFNAAAFSPDDQLIAGGGYDGRAHIFRVKDGAEVATLGNALERRVLGALAFSPCGSLLCDGSWWDGEIRVWDTTSWTLLRTLRAHGDHIQALAFSRDGRQLLSASLDGTAIVWCLENRS